MDYSYLDRNIKNVRERIDNNCEGRNVILLAAIKSAEVDEINYVHRELGVNDVGENRVQQLLARYELLDREGLNVHFIGHLQTNKVKYIIDKVSMIHSVDSERLAREINAQAQKRGITMKILVEINSGREESKDGVMPELAEALCIDVEKYKNIELCGFMTMAPKCNDKKEYLRYFGEIRELAADIWKNKLHKDGEPILSMGMSDSYEEAVRCGSTMVRVGSRLFAKS